MVSVRGSWRTSQPNSKAILGISKVNALPFFVPTIEIPLKFQVVATTVPMMATYNKGPIKASPWLSGRIISEGEHSKLAITTPGAYK